MIFRTTPKPNPESGDVLYNRVLHAFQIYNGITWDTVVKPIPCVVCKIPNYQHGMIGEGHPFLGNNLEYLEWKSEQADKR